ncbi:chromaffin granule amine transporter-like [Mya arenaria]|uniref:chromaffin granule amine transporter-like n=1 Tax=Mya arenaria TaxID=6604 RepID=UPI0022E0C64A|nr:chromaffin granule amine transporter-like [Mya arenaria]
MLAGTNQKHMLAGTNQEHMLAGTNQKHMLAGTNQKHMLAGTNQKHMLAGTNQKHMLAGTNQECLQRRTNQKLMQVGTNQKQLLARTNQKQLLAGTNQKCDESSALLRGSGRSLRALLAVVAFTNFLDYLLLTAVVPIIPDYLLEADRQADGSQAFTSGVARQLSASSIIYSRAENNNSIDTNATDGSIFEKALRLPVRAISENSRVGWLLGSKALVQIAANPVVGYLSNRVSYRYLLMFGTGVFVISASMLGASQTFTPLLIGRAVQGVGSAATTISGMSMLAEYFSEDERRSQAMGLAMGGCALGILVGYPFGGLLYALSGKTLPFVGIALLAFLSLGLQYELFQKIESTGKVETGSSSLLTLLWDPYIVLCAGVIMLTSMSLAVLESTVPLWVMGTMDAKQWQLGVADAAIMPLLALLMDGRHTSTYGSVYAIVQLAVCLAYSLGPAIAGTIVKNYGFKWAMWGMAGANLVYTPLCVLLRAPPLASDTQCILGDMDDDDDNIRETSADVPSYTALE